MAVTGLGLLGSGTATSAGTTLAVTNTTGAVIPAGTFIHITGCWDNTATTTAPTVTCSTVGGATATANHATAVGSGVTTTAGSGVWHQCFRVLTTASIASGATIATLTSNQSAVKRAAHAEGWSGALDTLRGTVTTGTSGAGTPTVTTTGTALVIGDLVIGSVSFENNAQMTADADTAGGAWPPIVGVFTTGGGAAANVGTATQYKILTATGTQTFNPTGGGADTIACVYSLQPVPDPTVTQAAFRFYADGTESGSTALAAQDTAYTADLTSGDANMQVRVRLQSTNTTPLPATDDWALQWSRGDGYDFSHYAGSVVSLYDTQTRTAQSFLGPGGPLTRATFYLQGFGNPTGTVSAVLYAHDGGSFGNTGLPTGSPLATSTNSVTASTIPSTAPTPTVFTFDGTVTLTAGTPYFIGLVATGATNAVAGSVDVSRGSSAPTHPGKQANFTTGWTAITGADLIFEVGTWTDVATPAGTLSDSYPISNWTSDLVFGPGTGASKARAQSFTGDGKLLTRAAFYMKKTATPNGTVTAKLYAHTGTYGTNGTPTGSVLATSNAIASTALPTSNAMVNFDFDGTYTLTNGTRYFIAVESTNSLAIGNDTSVGYDGTASAHAGSQARQEVSTSVWNSVSIEDLIFEVYTATPATTVAPYASALLDNTAPSTNRLGAGTGSFTAGDVTEDGVANDQGWPGNNYTEHVYSITLKQADLANADTVRFRVLRNGATTGMTYTQTPTVNITVGAGLTTVTITRPTTWNTEAAVALARATTWDVLTPVTALARATTWDVLAPVAAVTTATTWDVLAGASLTRATTWDTVKAVTQTWATTWDVLAGVAALTRSTTWGALAPVAALTRSTTWRVKGQPTITRATTWDVRTPVTLSPVVSWRTLRIAYGGRLETFTTTPANLVVGTGQTVSGGVLNSVNSADGWWYLSGANWTATGDFSLVVDTILTTTGSKEPVNIGFWLTSPGATPTGYVFRFHTSTPNDGGFYTVAAGVMTKVPGSPTLSGQPTAVTVRLTLVAQGDVVTATIGRPGFLTTQHTVTMPAGNRAGVFGQVPDTLAAAGHTVDNVAFSATGNSTRVRDTSWAVSAPVASVTITRATTWDALAAVVRTRATTWDVTTSVGITRSTTWDATALVTTLTRTTTWDAVSRVTVTRSTTWDVTTPLAISRATTWDASASVGIARATTWDATAVVASITRSTTWRARAAAQVTRSTTWNVAAPKVAVQVDRSTTWDASSRVTITRGTTWQAKATATGTRVATWDALASVTRTRSTTWDATTSVAVARATTWDVTTPVVRTRSTTWDAVAVVSTTRLTTWDVTTPVATVTRTATWDTLRLTGPAPRATTWNQATPTLGVVNIQRTTTWKTRQAITAARLTTWDTRTTVATVARATTWDTTAAITRTRATTWDLLAGAGTISRATTWHTRTSAAGTRAAVWDVQAITSLTRTATWDTRAAITRTRSTTWNQAAPTLGSVTVARATTWDTRLRVTQPRAATWDTKARLLTQPRTARWNVMASMTVPRSTTWRVLTIGPEFPVTDAHGHPIRIWADGALRDVELAH